MGARGYDRRDGRALDLGWGEHTAPVPARGASGRPVTPGPPAAVGSTTVGSAAAVSPAAVSTAAVSTAAVSTAAVATGAAVPTGDDDRPAPVPPANARSRRRRRLLAAGAVLALLVGALLGLPRMLGASTGPEQVARGFLQAVVDGDLETVRSHLAAPLTETAPGLSAEVLAGAEDRVDSFEIMEVTVDSRTAWVTARLRAGSESGTIVLTLAATGAGSFSPTQWELAPVHLPEVHLEIPVGVEEIEIEGVRVPIGELIQGERASTSPLVLQLLPGTYEVTLPDVPAWAEAPRIDLEVPLDVRERPTVVEGLHLTLDAQSLAEVRRQIDAVLETCASSTSSTPEGCPFSVSPVEGSVPSSWGAEQRMTSPGTWALPEEPALEALPLDARTVVVHVAGTAEFVPAPGSPGSSGPFVAVYESTALVAFDVHGDPHVSLSEDSSVITVDCGEGATTLVSAADGGPGGIAVPDGDVCG